MRFLALILSLVLIFTQQSAASAQSVSITPPFLSGQVVYIDDGDTFKIKLATGIITNVRLACVDAPEVPHTKIARQSTNQALINHYAWGAKSLALVNSLMPLKSNISLLPISVDYRYGRTVAEIILADGSNLAQREASLGLAQIYDEYISQCPDRGILTVQQNNAAAQRLGVWSDLGYVAPAIARKLALIDTSKSSPVMPTPPVVTPIPPAIPVTPIPPISCADCNNSGGGNLGLPACTLTKCNCSDFKTQAEAQLVLKAFPTDKFRLDANHDGIACNGLK